MRSTGLTAGDWHVIAQYIHVLQPLKDATMRLQGRGKSGRHGALYEVIPTFEHVLRYYEDLVEEYQEVDFNEMDAPENYLIINLKAAWIKAQKYWEKIDDSPAYYAATTLHPYLKNYCDNAWRDRSEWLANSNARF